MVKIIATSDLHGNLPEIPPCDLYIIAGDITPGGSSLKQALWLDHNFRNYLQKVPAKEIVIVAGNHDRLFQKEPHLIPKELRCHYLQDSTINLFGLSIYGTPWQLPFWGAFNASEILLKSFYELMPLTTDIIISHGPPYGLHDEVPAYNPDPDSELFENTIHVGSLALRDKIFQVKPKLVIYGHIHCSFGSSKVNEITFANVALVDNEMKVRNPPSIFII